jgi:hypothetical protein
MTDRGCCEDLPDYTGAVCIADTCDECWDNWNARKERTMTDKFKQIADCYGPGDFNDLEAKYIEGYVKHAARDVHLMWDEIQRLRAELEAWKKPAHNSMDDLLGRS